MKSTQTAAIASAAKPGRTGFQIERNKLLISILLGLMGFAGSFYSLNFGNPPFVISIDWCIFPPLLAGLAFGGRYGFIAATLGLGALYPLVLWPNNGWAAVVTSLLLVLCHSSYGYFTGLRRKRPAWWNHPWLFYPLFVLIFNVSIRVLFPIAFSFNPPFWYPAAELSMPLPVLDAIAVKGTVILFVIVIFDAYLLQLPPIRKLLGLEIKKEPRPNGRIALGVFLGSVLIWWVFILFNRIFIDRNLPQGLFQPHDPRETMALLVFLAVGIFIGAVVVQYAQSRLKAEDELRDSEERFRLLAENSTDLISRHTPEGVYLYASPVCRPMLGYEPEELVAHSAFEFIHPDDLPKIEQFRQRAVKTPVVSRVTYRVRRKDGDYLWLESTSHFIPVKNGGGTAEIQVTSRDVTDRQQAEAKVAASQKLLQDITDSSQSLIYALDSAGRYLLINRELETLFGIPRETLMGKTREAVLPPDVAAAHRVNDLLVIASRKPIAVEEENLEPDGKHTYLSVKFPLLDPQGAVYGIGGLSTDVTDRKQAERRVQEQNDLLQAQNEELTAQREKLQSINEELIAQQVELQQAEEELKQALERLGLATRAASLGIWDWDIPRNELVWDDQMYALYGLHRGDFSGAYEAWLAGVHPDDRAASDEVSRQAQRGERDYDTEFRVVWPDGTIRVLKAYGQCVRDAAGQPLRMTGVNYDITERVRSEQERCRAEEALRASEAKLRVILDATPFPVALVDLQDDQIKFWSHSALALFGHVAPTAAQWYQIAYPDPAYQRDVMERWRSAVENARQSSQAVNAGEYRVACRDGSVRICELYATFFADNLIVTFNDITGRQQAETLIQAQKEQLVAQNEELAAQNEELVIQARALEAAETDLHQINAELEQRVQARSAELRAANAGLQSANAAILRAGRLKDEFLANMSHELRTPLTGILGLAEVMQQGIYGDLSEKQRQALHLVQASGEHLLQLINDILDLSKIEAGKLEPQIAPVLIPEICQTSLDFVKQTAHQKNIRLIFQPDAQVRLVQADARRLKQMLVNLLSNAVKFTPEGGQVGLEVAGDPVRQRVRFTVWDTGIGIAPEQQAFLFQPFVQLDGSLARKYEGTGLGLALVHSIAELHGGSVTAESAGLGQGSHFMITLPWTLETPAPSADSRLAASAASQPVSLAARLGRPPVILAVDDNATTLMVLSSSLEALECQVIMAQNGAEALAQVEAARPDLILLDIHMPDLDGLTVLRRLRAAGSAIPVIALTALAMPSDREQCLAAGANDYLSKPMKLDELTRAISRWLRASEDDRREL